MEKEAGSGAKGDRQDKGIADGGGGGGAGGEGSGEAKTAKPRRERKEEEKPAQSATATAADQGGQAGGDGGAGKQRRRRPGGNDDAAESGGWMSMSEPKTAPKAAPEEDDASTQAGNKNKDKYFEDNNDEIMIIPDLDEDGIDNDQRVAHAPRNVTRKIPTLQDLENEVKATVPSVDSGFDLGVLLATLVPATLVEEADQTWTFQTLLRDVTDELTVNPDPFLSRPLP